MRKVNTIKGKISVAEVNKLLIHEHLLIDLTNEAVRPAGDEECQLFDSCVNAENIEALRKNPYVVYDNLILDDVDIAIAELLEAERAGVNLFVDVTTIGINRDITKLKQISDASNAHIVVGCGLFVHDSLSAEYTAWSVERISDQMLSDIEKGIDDTDIKAGIIGEIGTSEVIYPIEEKSLYAAARTYTVSGLPIMVHTYPWSETALQAAQLLLSEGVPPEKICICHVDVSFNESLILKLLELGVYVEFDNFGKEFDFEPQSGAFAGGSFETDKQRIVTLARLCEAGYTNRILLANDVCLKSLLKSYQGEGYLHLFDNIVPMIRDAKINEAFIHALIHENPIRFLFS